MIEQRARPIEADAAQLAQQLGAAFQAESADCGPRTWKPMAMSTGVSAASRSASTRSGSPLASRLNAPLANMWKLATPSPSERA